MTSFDADTLGALRELREVGVRTERHPQSAVVVWVVVAGGLSLGMELCPGGVVAGRVAVALGGDVV